ncbi:MAG: phenylalanine--tRNA ligase subunit beta [Polyangiaceae bacterium]|nr:phenylalanine--tRNA ligase subunit beta [Polyangiaceae bacterium]
MRISLRWLQQLVPGLQASATELGERLTASGLELDGIERVGEGLEAVRVAEVRRIEPHPSRDKLRLVTVSLGEREQTVVCGASNVPDPGGLVVLASIGTHLPAVNMTLEPRPIGGVVSEGMLCSEKELGLAEESEGILILPAGLKPGTPLPEALPECQDWILEVSITPNRPDALGHVGVAREVAALYDLEWQFPPAATPERIANQDLSALVRIDNQDTERCPHYGARAVLGVKIGPSPLWLQWRLQSLGIRPISNVVDITNLLLMEFGQPMHAFDMALLRGKQVVIRRATEQEPFKTLDGVERKLAADDLVICDAEGPVALAGVMGGENTEIRTDTQDVLLECAYFVPSGVRRTSRRQGLSTESSYRFERGVDYSQLSLVLDRATSLLCELAGGSAVPGAIHAKGELPKLPEIALRHARQTALLGVELDFKHSLETLRRLGLEVLESDADHAKVRGAAHRPDIGREVDLIEEVARVIGLDKIPTELPAIAPQKPRDPGLEGKLSGVAAGIGLSEAVTYAFVSERELDAVHAPKAAVRLLNPLTEERSVLRTSLLPGLLEALRRARRRGEQSLRLFSVGPIFLSPVTSAQDETRQRIRPLNAEDQGQLPEERSSFAAVLAGPRPQYLTGKPQRHDVFDAKGAAVELVERLLGRSVQIQAAAGESDTQHLHPRGAGYVLVEGHKVGRLGPLHPEVVDTLDLDGDAQVIELDIVALEALGTQRPKFKPIPRLPAVTRDVALVVGDSVQAGQLKSLISEAAGELCESVELFDSFVGGDLPAGHRSLAFRVVYRDPKAALDPDNARTLTDKEVDKAHTRAVQQAEKAVGATLRA